MVKTGEIQNYSNSFLDMGRNSPFDSSRLISVSLLILIVQFNVVGSDTPENWINAYFSWLFW